MTSATNEGSKAGQTPTRWVRIAQSIGAMIVTGLILWFLFGVPAYLLFGMFFD